MPTITHSASDAADTLRQSLDAGKKMASGLQSGAGELGAALKEQVDNNPIRSVLIAAGIGYVLGGGLAAPLTRQLVRLALRNLLWPSLGSPLASAWQAFQGATPQDTSAPASAGRS